MILVSLLMVWFLPEEVLVVCLVLYRLFRGLSSGVSFWLCRPQMLFILVLIILLSLGMSVVCWTVLKDGTVCISKVKGHADEGLVRCGRVRGLDLDGNNRADEAADFGRRRVWPEVIDAWRNLSGGTLSLSFSSFLYCHLSCCR